MRENFYGGEPPIFETIYVISPTASIDRSSQPFHRKELEDRIIIHDDMSSIDLLLDNILAYQQKFDIHNHIHILVIRVIKINPFHKTAERCA